MTRGRHLGRSVAVALLVLALGGCGSGDGAEETEPASIPAPSADEFPQPKRGETLADLRAELPPESLALAPSVGPPMEVAADSSVPDVGERAPDISTPTVASAGGAIEEIDTRVPPAPELHDADFADVVGEKPVALLFATPAFCMSAVCGPVVDVALEVRSAREDEDVEFIHQEIYEDNELEAGFLPQVRAFDLPTEPWLFTIDREGIVAARIEGAFSARELQQAVDAAIESPATRMR